MSRLELVRKLQRFLALNRIESKKRTKQQKEQLADLEAELGQAIEEVFNSVGIKAVPEVRTDEEADAGHE